jgi:hypothetical protein
MFTLVVCGVVISEIWQAFSGGQDQNRWSAALFGAFVVCLFGGQVIADILSRRRTSYAVTSQRVLISGGWPFAKVTALPLGRLDVVELTDISGDVGTISFGQPGRIPDGEGGTNRVAAPQFVRIADAQRVFRLVQEQKAATA